jgi:hypothetical protein
MRTEEKEKVDGDFGTGAKQKHIPLFYKEGSGEITNKYYHSAY